MRYEAELVGLKEKLKAHPSGDAYITIDPYEGQIKLVVDGLREATILFGSKNFGAYRELSEKCKSMLRSEGVGFTFSEKENKLFPSMPYKVARIEIKR